MHFSFGLIIWTAAAVAAFVLARKPNRSGRPYLPISFFLLMVVAVVMSLFSGWISAVPYAYGMLWLAWIVIVIATVLASYRKVMVAIVILAAAGVLALSVGGLLTLVGTSTSTTKAAAAPAQSLTIKGSDGKKQSVDYRDNTSQKGASKKSPVAGAAVVNQDYARPSLDCGADKRSWSDLVACVKRAPKAERDAYIAYLNAHQGVLGGNWTDVQHIAKQEKKEHLDTRVIVVANSDVSNATARKLAEDAAGSAAKKLPIVHINGALINTTKGVGATQLTSFADARSQVRVLLTVPAKSHALKANTSAARKGHGVLVECTNIATGIVKHPAPHPTPKPRPKPTHKPSHPATHSPKPKPSQTPTSAKPTKSPSHPARKSPRPTPSKTPTSAAPSSAPPSSAPPTSAPPSSAPPSSAPPTSAPPTTAPPTSAPPSETPSPCEWNHKLPANSPKCLATKPPSANPTFPSGKPTNAKPTGKESTAPVESNPAKPSTTPGASNPTMTGPGTDKPTESASAKPGPVKSVAPGPSDPGTSVPDPDGKSSSKTDDSGSSQGGTESSSNDTGSASQDQSAASQPGTQQSSSSDEGANDSGKKPAAAAPSGAAETSASQTTATAKSGLASDGGPVSALAGVAIATAAALVNRRRRS